MYNEPNKGQLTIPINLQSMGIFQNTNKHWLTTSV